MPPDPFRGHFLILSIFLLIGGLNRMCRHPDIVKFPVRLCIFQIISITQLIQVPLYSGDASVTAPDDAADKESGSSCCPQPVSRENADSIHKKQVSSLFFTVILLPYVKYKKQRIPSGTRCSLSRSDYGSKGCKCTGDYFTGTRRSLPPMYGRRTAGTLTEPSA